MAVTIDWLVSSVVDGSHGGRDRGVDSVVGNGVGNHGGSVDSVGNNRGSVDSVSHNRGGVVSWGNLEIRGISILVTGFVIRGPGYRHGCCDASEGEFIYLDNGSWLVGWGRLVVGWSRGWDIRLGLGVGSGSLVGDLSNIAVISVGGVGHLLDPAVGKSHSVGTLDVAGTIGGLLGVEV